MRRFSGAILLTCRKVKVGKPLSLLTLSQKMYYFCMLKDI